VRLDDVAEAYGDRVRVQWRTFPLIPDRRPDRRASAATQEGRRRAGAEEPRALFAPPEIGTPLPESSVPALTAVKCAEAQGPAAFAAFHRRLFVAHFRDNLDIGRVDMLRSIARTAGLDVERFTRDFTGGPAYDAVLRDYAEGAAWFGVSALPTVVFDEKLSLVGAVPGERYRALLDWILAGRPGGIIELGPAPAAGSDAAPGQTPVGPTTAS
jgi:predicted DsbA family dithiol-disulfide isomerase